MGCPRRVCVVGLGLIGGSIGMALVQRSKGVEVVGVDVNPAVVAAAVRQEAVHRATTNLAEGVNGADLVILAVPPAQMGRVARAMAPNLSPEAVVTDVASTKQKVVRDIQAALPGTVAYVGGHPMAGSERAGIAAADPYLFENAVWALTPTSHTKDRALEVVGWLVAELGARPLLLTPSQHDLAVAVTSHLPYLAAVALANTLNRLGSEDETAFKLAGRGFRDTTRVAGSDPSLWCEILMSNQDQVVEVLRVFVETLQAMMITMTEGDWEALASWLAQGREVRSRLPSGLRPYIPALEEVVITIPDRPGSLAQVAVLLGQAGINIADIEIMGVREGEGGSVSLAFATDEEAQKAVEILQKAGIRGRRR